MLGAIGQSPLVDRCGTVYRQRITRTEERSDLPRTPRTEEGLSDDAVNQAGELWNRCTGSFREQVSETTWQLWLSGIEPVTFADGVFVLSVPNGLHPRAGGDPLSAHDRGHAGQRGRFAGAGAPRGPAPRAGRTRAGGVPGCAGPGRSQRPAGAGSPGHDKRPRIPGGPTRPEVRLRDLRRRLLEPAGPRGGTSRR